MFIYMTTMLNFYSHPLQDLNCQCTNHVGSLLLWRPLYNQVTSDRSDRSDSSMFPNMGFIIRLLLLWMLIVCSRAEGEAVRGYLHTSYTYEESPRGAASGMSICHFFGWLLMSLLSFYHVQLGWSFNMLVSELGGVNCLWPFMVFERP